MKTEDKNHIIELENKIINFILQDNSNNCTVHFDYSATHEFDNQHASELSGTTVVYIFTHNPYHGVNFLFNKSYGFDEESALENALKYLKDHHKTQYTFTVEWRENEDDKTHQSYFTGEDMFSVLEKFYYKKVRSKYFIFKIKVNPIA